MRTGLVLTRRLEESISIAEGFIQIKVVKIKGSQVRLQVIAPKDIHIDRVDKNGVIEKR